MVGHILGGHMNANPMTKADLMESNKDLLAFCTSLLSEGDEDG